MSNDRVYKITFNRLKNSHNQPLEMALSDLVDELEEINAIPKDTLWQIRLALMHHDQEQLSSQLHQSF